MNKKLPIILITVFFSGASVVALFLFIFFQNEGIHSENRKGDLPTHASYSFDKESFFEGVVTARRLGSYDDGGILAGGVIPHHTLPGFLIARFFLTLSDQETPPERIILIGPNHPDAGSSIVLTSSRKWETPFGRVDVDEEIVNKLLSQAVVGEDASIISREHSVVAIMPYIKYYLPEARVVPIVIQSKADAELVRRLTELLTSVSEARTVVVAAVDFSHYLTAAEATEKDRETKHLLLAFESDAFYDLGNEYLDSPASIALLLEMMKVRGVSGADIFENTNSGFLSGDFRKPVTSYFTVGFFPDGIK